MLLKNKIGKAEKGCCFSQDHTTQKLTVSDSFCFRFHLIVSQRIFYTKESSMDSKIQGVIAMQRLVDDVDYVPAQSEVELLRSELEGAGFEIVHLGKLGGVSIKASRTLIKDVLGIELPDPPYGSHQHIKPTLQALSSLELILEIYPPIQHF
jgi:hypothetical protein